MLSETNKSTRPEAQPEEVPPLSLVSEDILNVINILRNAKSDIENIRTEIISSGDESAEKCVLEQMRKFCTVEEAIASAICKLQICLTSSQHQISSSGATTHRKAVVRKSNNEDCNVEVTPKVEFLSEYLNVEKVKTEQQNDRKVEKEIKVELDEDAPRAFSDFTRPLEVDSLDINDGNLEGLKIEEHGQHRAQQDEDEDDEMEEEPAFGDDFFDENFAAGDDAEDNLENAPAVVTDGSVDKADTAEQQDDLVLKKEETVNSPSAATPQSNKYKRKKVPKSSGGGEDGRRGGVGEEGNFRSYNLNCYICKQMFQHRKEVQEHVSIAHGPGPYTCAECNKSYPLYLQLQACYKKHDRCKGPRVTCKICNVEMQEKNLRLHMKRHSGILPYKCDLCDKRFVEKGFLNKHKRRIHDKIFSCYCDICGKGFDGQQNLLLHKRTHTGEKLNTCEQCGMSFNQKGHLKRHILGVHEGKKQPSSLRYRKNMICGKCGKSFKGSQSLQKHELTHSEVREGIKCEICAKSFLHANNLHRHIKVIHKGERTQTCRICNHSFADKWALKQHMPVHGDHTEVKPQQCDICHKSFVHVRSLKAHLVKHHDMLQHHHPQDTTSKLDLDQEEVTASQM